jgi:hypothetical protein
MHANPPSLGPVFTSVKHQGDPTPKVQDLGIQMQWGRSKHTARLYRNTRVHTPFVFSFDDVVIHEEDVVGGINYQPHLSRNTLIGVFYPFSAFLLAIYNRKEVNRNVFSALAELDGLLPVSRPVTADEAIHYCHTLFKSKGLPAPLTQPDPQFGLLREDLEMEGFHVTTEIRDGGRTWLNIIWLPKPGGHTFFTGVIERRQTQKSVTVQWMLPGPCGVNRILRQEFEQICPLAECLIPERPDQPLPEIGPTHKVVKHHHA